MGHSLAAPGLLCLELGALPMKSPSSPGLWYLLSLLTIIVLNVAFCDHLSRQIRHDTDHASLPMWKALDTQQEQLTALEALLSQITERLQPVPPRPERRKWRRPRWGAE